MGAGSSMNAELWFGVLQAAVLIVALVLLYRPVGDYMAHVFSTPRAVSYTHLTLPTILLV